MKTVRAEGIGMSPTIKDGDNLVIGRRAYDRDAAIARFDIIAFMVSSDLFHYKRVIGLPGEKIEIKNGEVFVDDKLLHEPFEKEDWSESNFGPLVIPEAEYFVLGDNRINSADSRIWQPSTIKRKSILGKIVEIVPAKK
ncbi:MAG TPA: signal peptidase I [Pyrinomonadaceae bacterium]